MRSECLLVEAFALGFFARDFLQVALYRSSFLALAFLGRFLIILATAQFRQDASLYTGTLETPQSGVEIFVLFYANTGHTNSGLLIINKPGTGPGPSRAL